MHGSPQKHREFLPVIEGLALLAAMDNALRE
jgi:hypothetical protein